jgi:quercetin dioxygenase-like cupin family protein
MTSNFVSEAHRPQVRCARYIKPEAHRPQVRCARYIKPEAHRPQVRCARYIKHCALGIVIAAGALFAQSSGIQRTVVKRADVSVPGREAIIARVEIAPGSFVGRHTHFGEEISYIMEGEGEILVEGQPPLKVKSGDGFVVPAGAKHDAHNTGAMPLKVVAVYVVDKGKALATPAP